jgi:hypothetical protein
MTTIKVNNMTGLEPCTLLSEAVPRTIAPIPPGLAVVLSTLSSAEVDFSFFSNVNSRTWHQWSIGICFGHERS